jgi:hypothetical protein
MKPSCRTSLGCVLWAVLMSPAMAQGRWALSSSDPQDLIVTNLTSDRVVSVTNNAGSEKITVTVFEDLDGDGKYDALKDLYIGSTFIEAGSTGSVDVPAGRECEITRFHDTGAAKGSWAYL